MIGDELLARFFEKYPSALGTTRAGGQYQLICPSCGDMIAVAVPEEDDHAIYIACANCGYADDLTERRAGVAA